MAAASAKGKRPGRQPLDMAKIDAALKLVEAKTPPAEAAKQLGLGRSTVYREMRPLGVSRPAWRYFAFRQAEMMPFCSPNRLQWKEAPVIASRSSKGI